MLDGGQNYHDNNDDNDDCDDDDDDVDNYDDDNNNDNDDDNVYCDGLGRLPSKELTDDGRRTKLS